jgi:hemoglobin
LTAIYDRLGDENLQLLVDKFYDEVLSDARIAHLFQTDIEIVKSKQFMFLSQFLGGPPRYAETYGHPRMRMRHMPHKIDQNAAHAWLECMAEAISKLPIDEGFQKEVFERFPSVAAHMINC